MSNLLFNSRIFALKNTVFRAGSLKYYNLLKTQQCLAPQQIDQLNFEKRRELVRFASKHTRFYRRVFEECGITPDDIRRPEDFVRLPIVTREHLRACFDEFISDKAAKGDCCRATTGGSTGMPISVLYDRRVSIETALWRVVRWWDVEPSDDIAFIYRLRRIFPFNLLNDLLWWPTRRIFLDAALMTQETMRSFLIRYNNLKPTILQGYVGAVYEFTLFLRDNGLTITPPKAVWVTSAPLSEAQRSIMQSVFQAPVYDQYGSCEIPWLAAECKERNGLHIMHDIRHIEFVDTAGMPVPDGEWGRVLVTDLENRVFPLIRYEIGDVGRRLMRTCPCGVTLPLMDKVRGRVSDRIRLPDGRSISGEFLTTLFDDHPEAVKMFQIYQRADFSITLSCVEGVALQSREIIDRAFANLRDRIGEAVPVKLQLVKHIPHDRGKTRFIISDVGK